MFRNKYSTAWFYHRNSSRWLYNTLQLDENRRVTPPFKEFPSSKTVSLPAAEKPLVSLTEAITSRVSCRRFAGTSVSLGELSTVLHWSYGILGQKDFNGQETLLRPVPSGGGLYPLEVYPICLRVEGLEPGIYHYQPLHHLLEVVQEGLIPSTFLSELFMAQPYITEASFILVISAVFDRSMWKYEDRGYRYILLEAGHLAQNANLISVGLGLGCLNLGGFFDADLINLLDFDAEQEAPLYGVVVGKPEAGAEDFRIPLTETIHR